MHFSKNKCNASFAREVEREVMTHTAVAPSNPGFLDEDIERRRVGAHSPKIVQRYEGKRELLKLTEDSELCSMSRNVSLRKSSSPTADGLYCNTLNGENTKL